MSSLFFQGNATSFLSIPNTNEFDFGTGDFTIEWYQYQTDNNPFPRIFQVGSIDSNDITIGVSIEGGQFYYWTNTRPIQVTVLDPSSYKNKWVHFAIARHSDDTQIFMNGTSIITMNDTNNYDGANNLTISNESTPSDDAAFGGYISYFTWVKGVALYTANFTVPNSYPTFTEDYVLLLTASSFDGTLGNTVVNHNVLTVPNTPFGSNAPSSNALNLQFPFSKKSIFSNNSLVFYKQGSLASCGVGSVRNSSTKSRRI